MVNMTGSNLTGIMETMKFAYHATSYNDFLNLKSQISTSNFTYKMSTSMEFSESTYDVIMISINYYSYLVINVAVAWLNSFSEKR